MVSWSTYLEDLCDDNSISSSCLYNAYHKGLFYQSFWTFFMPMKVKRNSCPERNRLTIKWELLQWFSNKHKSGLHQLHSLVSQIIHLVLIFSVLDCRHHFTIESKIFFSLIKRSQRDAYQMFSGMNIWRKWDVNSVLIFDNYLAHNIYMLNLFPRLKIKLLPPNVNNKYQPGNIRVITGLKVG